MTVRRLPQASPPSQGSGSSALTGPAGPARPSSRSFAPSATSAEGSVSPGPSTARHHPPSGFLTPSTGCSPSGLADSLGPLPLLGFSLAWPFRRRPECVAALPATACPRLSSLGFRGTRVRDLRSFGGRCSLPLVPRPWFQGPRAPFGALHSRAVAEACAAARPLACPDPSLSGRTQTWSGRHPRVFHQPGNRRIFVRSAAPMGFSPHRKAFLAPSDALSARYRHTRRSRKVRGRPRAT